ncbi:MAG: hypothetical protein L3J57_07075 [Desulfuromusa sp.]|nr:hypothetical protein [Desulfuromusa sp.]
MVKGLDRFKEHFKGYSDRYALIGGSACTVAMEEVDQDFRATKDLDIVLCIEVLDPEFVVRFWEFIKLGGYENKQQSTGEKRFYRFHTPTDKTFPFMLELFSRLPDALNYKGPGHLTPIPVDDEVSSLSAILLNDAYYTFIHAGKRKVDGLPIVGQEHLIPLKGRAWLDLSEKKQRGEAVKSRDIKKHKLDVFRLYRIISPDVQVVLPEMVRNDMNRFLEEMKSQEVDLKALGFKRGSQLETILMELREFYGLGD